MKLATHLSIILASILLNACSSGSDQQDQTAAEQNKTLLKAVQKPLEQAGQVQQQIQDAAEAERKKIDEQSE